LALSAELEPAIARTGAARPELGLGFELSDEQRLLRETVRDFVERECPKPVARELAAAGRFPLELWRKMTAAGLHGIGIDPEHGGEGGGIVEQAIVAEELARSLAGLAFAWTAHSVVVAGLLATRPVLLEELARGTRIWSVALDTDLRASSAGQALRVAGSAGWSICGLVADRLLLSARRDQGPVLLLVDGDAAGLARRPAPKLGLAALAGCELVLDDVAVGESDVLGTGGRRHALRRSEIMTASVCVGILQGVLEDAVRYAGERRAFSKPIGQFQAIQHGIADVHMRLETARLHTRQAAWLEAEGRDCGLEASIASCLSSEFAAQSADFGIQLLGGYGYSLEYDMQRYWRDARMCRAGPPSADAARERVAASLAL